VSFDEAVERMQKTGFERAAVEAQRNSRGDGAEADANNDAKQPGHIHGGLEKQGGAELTHNETTDWLRSLGAWVVAPVQSVRPLLARIPGLRQSGGRGPPSSIALDARDVDVERMAGTSVSTESERSEEGHTSPATAPEGGQDDGAGHALADRSRADSVILAREREGGDDGAQAPNVGMDQGDAQAQSSPQAQDGEWDDRGQAEERTHDEHIHAQETEEEVATPDVSRHGDNAAIRGSPDVGRTGEQGWDGEHDDNEEHGEDEEHSRDDERCQSDEGGRDDEHADQQGRDRAQELDDDQSHDGERKRDGEQTQDGAQKPDDERDRAGEETSVQRVQTPEGTDEAGAREDAGHGGSSEPRGISGAGEQSKLDRDVVQGRDVMHGQDVEQDRDVERGREVERSRDSEHNQNGELGQAGQVTHPRRSHTRDAEDEASAPKDAGMGGEH
ncbi:hypothetical protein FB107DRAFT_252377, partial [Schizophyllum commune]